MGAWIEIKLCMGRVVYRIVAPLVGAWIEIGGNLHSTLKLVSLPLWERGLKLLYFANAPKHGRVAPLVGAWIEISLDVDSAIAAEVAPLVGAWIEIIQIF